MFVDIVGLGFDLVLFGVDLFVLNCELYVCLFDGCMLIGIDSIVVVYVLVGCCG